ncbi:MAG: C_GCAxxG_C_C family protein [Oscillospiraceae bacterium]|nr:C_GCAxxG_C_C family protein [Oscillospiraceae bacterium]
MMNLQEQAKMYYTEQGKNCAVAMLLAGSDVYGLGLGAEDAKLLVGFGGGMGCGSTCGALAGSIAVLGKLFSTREDFRVLCGKFVKLFREGLQCDSVDCAKLAAKHKSPDRKCEAVVVKAAELLGKFIAENA